MSHSFQGRAYPVPAADHNVTKQAVVGIMETLALDLDGTNVGASVFCPEAMRPIWAYLPSRLLPADGRCAEDAASSPQRTAKPDPELKDGTRSSGPRTTPESASCGVSGDMYILTHPNQKALTRATLYSGHFPTKHECAGEVFPLLHTTPYSTSRLGTGPSRRLKIIIWNGVFG